MRKNATEILALFSLMVIILAACDSSPTEAEPESLIDAVRAETLKFQSPAVAVDAGYIADGHCVAHPDMGGMGDHWVNNDLVDPQFDPMIPEALLYGPGSGGGAELVAVEYIVVNIGQDRPEFDGQPFDIGGVPPLEGAGVEHWSLHVWLHMDNSAGMFAPFNPQLSCG